MYIYDWLIISMNNLDGLFYCRYLISINGCFCYNLNNNRHHEALV